MSILNLTSGIVFLKGGSIPLGPGSAGAPAITFGDADTGIFSNAGSTIQFTFDSVNLYSFQSNGFFLFSDTAQIVMGSAFDTVLTRDAANTFAMRNGTTAQSMRWYGTYTDAANYIRLSLNYDGTSFNLTQQNAGTGSAKQLTLGVANAAQWALLSTGHFVAASDATFDIGASGANRPRNLFISGVVTSGSTTFHATSAALTNNAAAQTATMTNGPTAGNPTKWIPINDNGTTRNIPAW